MQFYDRLRELREDKDLTQKEIADMLQIDQSYYSKYERGKHPMQIDQLKTLCEYYNVSADYILGLPMGLSWPREPEKSYNPTK